ncbi:MAG: diguanylate cyclase [Pirellulaceae bacterium]
MSKTILRISFSIVMAAVAAILLAALVGVVPDERSYQATSRKRLCEAVATSVSYLVGKHDLRQIGSELEVLASRNEDLISVGVRRSDGLLVVEIGRHRDRWSKAYEDQSDGCYVVPINSEVGRWGTLELHFKPLYAGTERFLSPSLIKLSGFVIVLVGVSCWMHLNRILRFLDPNRSVPPRVREALDNFAEGVVVLDPSDRIVLANDTFAKYVRRPQDELTGMILWDLPWEVDEDPDTEASVKFAQRYRGRNMRLKDDAGKVVAIFSVNSSPVLDDQQHSQGLMMAFTDVTPLEQSRAAFELTLQDLNRSRQEITQQNEELRYLATRDPLTSCINRRTFFELFEKHWKNASEKRIPLSAMMVDIDFFKSINDTYGHSAGDEVLRQTGALLNKLADKNDVVCRYGGEEFSILLPGSQLDAAEQLAEKIRVEMSNLEFDGFKITASLGLSEHSLQAADPQGLLDQADKCLYVAKRNGRNQVVRFDTVPEDLIVDESKISRVKPSDTVALAGPTIPYPAVTALVSALTYRDQQTGTHSVRVSSYAAMLAQRSLSPSQVYVIEIAALLHDIGKIGVPDAILLKPGKLTDEEWLFMAKHDHIGVEIISRSFKHPGLTDIVRYHHFKYGGPSSEGQSIRGTDLPIGARILTIVDSFDAMVSDRPYRKGMPVEKAIAELRACSGTQFDPQLVEEFISLIEVSGVIRERPAAGVYSADVALHIGEQVERLVEAADSGDAATFVALAERLRQTAEQHDVADIANAAKQAIESASEDQQIERLVQESFELLSVCRAMRRDIVSSNSEPAAR